MKVEGARRVEAEVMAELMRMVENMGVRSVFWYSARGVEIESLVVAVNTILVVFIWMALVAPGLVTTMNLLALRTVTVWETSVAVGWMLEMLRE